MKFILLLTLLALTFGTYTSAHELSRKEKAQIRAAQHPKGSGIGTNRYSTGRYDKVPYRIEKYQRVSPKDKHYRR